MRFFALTCCILSLVLVMSACGKNEAEEKKSPKVSEDLAPDRGPVDLNSKPKEKNDRAARSDVPRGYDPAKWDKLPEATKRVIERENALMKKRQNNPDMNEEEYMKTARGGEPQKQYKF